MKPRIFALLLLPFIFLSSCQKSSVAPTITPSTSKTTTTTVAATSTPLNQGIDSLSNIKGFLRLQLAKDSINTDNILINFLPTAKTTYVGNEDAPTFQGFGQVSLSSLSSDNVPLAINALPLTKKGLSIGVKVNAKTDGVYRLKMMTIKSVPTVFDIWLMDKYKKDSLDLRQNPSYAFNIIKADTSSFGSHRFKLVIRQK